MEEANEKAMDDIAYFKMGQSILVTDQPNERPIDHQNVHLLAYSNRFGFAFYASQNQGLTIISSTHIDQASEHLSKSLEDDEDLTSNASARPTILRRAYIPGGSTTKPGSISPQWIALNADETILAILLIQQESQDFNIILYDTVNIIQSTSPTPLCPPMRWHSDQIGGCVTNFAWNPSIPTTFAFLDGNGQISTMNLDLTAKRATLLGKCAPNENFSSICWSPKGKQLVVVTFDGALLCYDASMNLKTQYPSPFVDQSFPPCLHVLWFSNNEYLLGFGDSDSDGDSNFFALLTYEKDQPVKIVRYFDLFSDVDSNQEDVHSQFYLLRLNETKILFTGLSKSLKINVLGSDDLNQNALDIWTFDDQYRPVVKGRSVTAEHRPILTGMAIALNSTLNILERNRKLPPAPILLLSNSEGVLQVYYFVHKSLPSLLRPIEPIKVVPTASTQMASNGFSFGNSGPALSTNNSQVTQPKDKPLTMPFAFNASSATPAPPFAFNTPSTPVPPAQSVAAAAAAAPPPSIVNNQKLLQMVDEYQTRVAAVIQPLPPLSDESSRLQKSMEGFNQNLNTMKKTIKESLEAMQVKLGEHIEIMTRIEDTRYHMRLSQKETSHDSLKDRELDPWTQHRLESIQSRFEKLKHNFHLLLQIVGGTVQDKSVSIDIDDDAENLDFQPDLQVSFNTEETMKQRLQKRVLRLAKKITETSKNLEQMEDQFQSLSLKSSPKKSEIIDSEDQRQSMYAKEARLFAHLKQTHTKSMEVEIPAPVTIQVTSKPAPTRPMVPPPTTSAMSNNTPLSLATSVSTSTAPVPESLQNMMRIVQTSIDLFSGAMSPEQLRTLANMTSTSPFIPTSKPTATKTSNNPQITATTPINKGATMPASVDPTIKNNPPANATVGAAFQTPMKSNSSPIPAISITPATPATHPAPTDATAKTTANKTAPLPATSGSATDDSAIRSLLSNPGAPASTPITSVTTGQEVKPSPFAFSTSTSGGTMGPLAPTIMTSVQSTSPTTKPLVSTMGFSVTPSSNPTGPLSSALPATSTPATSSSTPSAGSLTTTAASVNTGIAQSTPFAMKVPVTNSAPSVFGAPAVATPFGASTTTTTTAPSIFGGSTTATSSSPSIFGTTSTTASSTPSTFGAPSTSAPSIFGGSTTTTSSAPGIFGTATTTSAPSPFGTAPTAAGAAPSVFGSPPPTTSSSGPFGAVFGGSSTATTTSTVTNMFGSMTVTSTAPSSGIFGANNPSTSSASTPSPFGGFGSTASTASSTGAFGSPNPVTSTAPTTSIFGGFGNPPSSSASGTAPFGSTFGSTTTSNSSPFSFSFGGASTSSTTTAASSPATSTSSAFGASGFGSFSFKSPIPTTSIAPTTSAPLFGSAATSGASFGSSFSGFGAAKAAPASGTTGFTFGGFGGAPAQTNPGGFGGFGAATTPTSSASFGAAPQTPSGAFGGSASSFGSPPSATSPSFTAYRK